MVTHERCSLASGKQWWIRVCCGLLFAFVAQSATAQIRTVLVSPVPGNPAASGTALVNALAGISAPSSTNRWLLKIEPGIYDVGATSLAMRSWVDVEGSGIGVTTVRRALTAPAGATAGTVNGASDAELRLLTVEATGSGTATNVIAMYNSNAHPRLYRVKLTSYGGTDAWGIKNVSSAPQLEECDISASAAGEFSNAYGVSFQNYLAGFQRTAVLRSKIAVWGARFNYGIYSDGGLTITEVRNSRIDATGGSFTYGILATGNLGWQGGDGLTIRDVEVYSGGGALQSFGVYLGSGTTVSLDVTASKVWGHAAPTTYGIYQGGNTPAVLQSSHVVGYTRTVQSDGGPVSIASTHLLGGAVIVWGGGWLGCMGVWDENAVFYASSCP